MTTMTKTKRAAKAQDKLIEKIYYAHCSGMQINIMRISKLFAMARNMLDQGASEPEVGAGMVAFIQQTE
jgi:hypothetical protein